MALKLATKARAPGKKAIGKSLKAARIRAGFTRVDAAKHLHVTRFSLYHWERGTRTPSLWNYFRAMKLYGVIVTAEDGLANPSSSGL